MKTAKKVLLLLGVGMIFPFSSEPIFRGLAELGGLAFKLKWWILAGVLFFTWLRWYEITKWAKETFPKSLIEKSSKLKFPSSLRFLIWGFVVIGIVILYPITVFVTDIATRMSGGVRQVYSGGLPSGKTWISILIVLGCLGIVIFLGRLGLKAWRKIKTPKPAGDLPKPDSKARVSGLSKLKPLAFALIKGAIGFALVSVVMGWCFSAASNNWNWLTSHWIIGVCLAIFSLGVILWFLTLFLPRQAEETHGGGSHGGGGHDEGLGAGLTTIVVVGCIVAFLLWQFWPPFYRFAGLVFMTVSSPWGPAIVLIDRMPQPTPPVPSGPPESIERVETEALAGKAGRLFDLEANSYTVVVPTGTENQVRTWWDVRDGKPRKEGSIFEPAPWGARNVAWVSTTSTNIPILVKVSR